MYSSNNVFPFATMNDHKLYQTLRKSNNLHCYSSDSYPTKTCLALKPAKILSNLFNEFSNLSSQKNKGTKNIISYKYYNIDEAQSLNNANNKDTLNIFHINTCSLPKNIEELEYLIEKTKIDFDIITNSESRIKKSESPINTINLKDYFYIFLEFSVGGTLLLIISNYLSYKPRSDLCIY